MYLKVKGVFQFTHPGRGATSSAGGTPHSARGFNSRTPGGVRLWLFAQFRLLQAVSIHAPREGCDYVLTPSVP